MTTKATGIVSPNDTQEIPFTVFTGVTPTYATLGGYVNNSTLTTMTDILLPTGRTSGRIILLGANANTTLFHGIGMILFGSANVVLPTNGILELIKYAGHSPIWIEINRNF